MLDYEAAGAAGADENIGMILNTMMLMMIKNKMGREMRMRKEINWVRNKRVHF